MNQIKFPAEKYLNTPDLSYWLRTDPQGPRGNYDTIFHYDFCYITITFANEKDFLYCKLKWG